MSLYRHHKMTGLDLYFSSQTSVCRPHSALQLTPGELNISLWQLSQQGVEVSRQIADRALYLETVTPSTSVRLLLSSKGEQSAQWCGFSTTDDTILVVPDDFGFYASPEFWEDIDIILPNQVAIDLGINPFELHTLTHPSIRLLSVHLRHLFKNNGSETKTSGDWFSHLLEELRKCARHAIPSKPLTHSKRQSLVHRALDYVREHQEDCPEMTVEQLSHHLGTTGRTLQRAFNDSLGITPYSFLLNVRLNAAHLELMKNSPNTLSVTELGAEFGFTSTSKFIEHYRRFYDVTPSVTLKGHNLKNKIGK